jgi:hypothetical protein
VPKRVLRLGGPTIDLKELYYYYSAMLSKWALNTPFGEKLGTEFRLTLLGSGWLKLAEKENLNR